MTLRNKTIGLIGCGDIGCRLGEQLLQQGVVVHGYRRSVGKIPEGFIGHAIDVCDPGSMQGLKEQHFDYLVVTLSPAELSDEAYQATYVQGLKNILANINKKALRKLFWVSSTSVYGQADGSWIDEASVTEPTRFSGKRQLEAEQCLQELADKACVIRFAGIYREDRHRMIEKIMQGNLSAKVDNDYYTNRIQINDCVGVLAHLINKDASDEKLERIYIGSDSTPVLYSELIQWLSEATGCSLNTDGDSQTPRVGSKRCSNKRLLDSGYQFIYPGYQQGFTSIIKNTRSKNDK